MSEHGFGEGKTIRIVHLEDDPYDREWVEAELARLDLPTDITLADDLESFLRALQEKKTDLIISDYSMPTYNGVKALQLVRDHHQFVPFIFFSGTMGEEAAIDSLKSGATDYVLKQHPERLVPAIQRALSEAREHAARLNAEEKIREQAALLNEARDAICVNDLDQMVLFWNKSAERLYGWTAAEAMGRNANELLLQNDVALTAMKTLISRGEWQGELHQKTRSGQQIIVQSRWTLIRNSFGAPKSILTINTDITEKKQIEAQFLRTQRMENLGALASGIAHDLNNILTPIMMAAEILQQSPDSRGRQQFLKTIQTSAKRGSDLVNQILSFTRGVKGEMAPVQLRHVIGEVVQLISDTLPRTIIVNAEVPRNLPTVLGDSTQLHQVLLNLCVNARDAMPRGGALTIQCQVVELKEHETPMQANPLSGDFIKLRVSDNGCGIPPDLRVKIFEPFFTTKDIGKGTGLGLSTVTSIVKNHGGFIEIDSELDKGTTFSAFFPAVPLASTLIFDGDKTVPPQGNGELILVVEDESAILEITQTTLCAYNYRVLTANNGLEAVELFKQHAAEIDLVISDMMMPHLEGSILVKLLREVEARVKIVAVSGMAEQQDELADSPLEEVNAFLRKPFTTTKLLSTIHAILAKSAPPRDSAGA